MHASKENEHQIQYIKKKIDPEFPIRLMIQRLQKKRQRFRNRNFEREGERTHRSFQ